MILPAFQAIRISNVPEKATKAGVLFFVTDDNDNPIGIAKSNSDLSIKFYSVIPANTAQEIRFRNAAIPDLEAENVQEVMEELFHRLQAIKTGYGN